MGTPAPLSAMFSHADKFRDFLFAYLEDEFFPLTLQLSATKIAEFANSVVLDEVAHHEPPHLDLHCSPTSLQILDMI